MSNVFKCGLIRVCQSNNQPDWNESIGRAGFAQDKLRLNAAFMSALIDSGDEWIVPFFSVEDSMGRFAKVQLALSECNPCEVIGVRKLDLTKVELEAMRSTSALVPELVR